MCKERTWDAWGANMGYLGNECGMLKEWTWDNQGVSREQLRTNPKVSMF